MCVYVCACAVQCNIIPCINFCNCHHNQDTNCLSLPPQLPWGTSLYLYPFLHSASLSVCSLYLSSFVILKMLCKWIHLVCKLLRLTFFPNRNAPEAHSGCCIYQQFVPMYWWVVFHCMDTPDFVQLFIHWNWLFPVLCFYK